MSRGRLDPRHPHHQNPTDPSRHRDSNLRRAGGDGSTADACSSSDDDSGEATADGSSTTVVDAGTADAVTVDEVSADDGESTAVEVGTGVVRVDGSSTTDSSAAATSRGTSEGRR